MALPLPARIQARRLGRLDLQLHPHARVAHDLWSSTPLASRMPALCDAKKLDDVLPFLPIPVLPRGNSHHQFDVIGQFGVLELVRECRPEVVYLQIPSKKEARNVAELSQVYLLIQQPWPVHPGLLSQNALAKEMGVHKDRVRRAAEKLFTTKRSDERALLDAILTPAVEASNLGPKLEERNGNTEKE